MQAGKITYNAEFRLVGKIPHSVGPKFTSPSSAGVRGVGKADGGTAAARFGAKKLRDNKGTVLAHPTQNLDYGSSGAR